VIGDIDGDGALEIVFGTYVSMEGPNRDGPVGVWGLEADGTVMSGFPLPVGTPGVRAAPTLADLDGDGNLEILVDTITGYVLVWDTPAPYIRERMPWPTGRHDLRRSATHTRSGPNLSTSSKRVSPTVLEPPGTLLMNTLHYTVTLANTGEMTATTILLTDTLPSSLTIVDGPISSSGSCAYQVGSRTITWAGSLAPNASVNITYTSLVSTVIGVGETMFIVNKAQVDGGTGASILLKATVAVNPRTVYLPIVMREY
jgi:uncharacterized repeat protein (TIGR01451 family)